MLISLKRSFEGVPMLCKENQRTFQPKPPDDQGLTKPFWHETFHIRELSIRTQVSSWKEEHTPGWLCKEGLLNPGLQKIQGLAEILSASSAKRPDHYFPCAS
jgi:hypothetical protein